jgi:peptide/nickel transport system permease protein
MKIRYVVKRLLSVIPVVFGVLFVVFILLHMMPGDPSSALLGPEAVAEDVERIRKQLGLDQNIFVQMVLYMKQLLTFDFGRSIVFKQPVVKIIGSAFQATLELSVMGLLIALLIAVPLGILSAVRQNSWLDNIAMFLAQLGISMPVFWMGLFMIMLFAVKLNWLTSFGRGEALWTAFLLALRGNFTVLAASLKRIAMPSFALGFMGAAMISRMIRSTMLEVLDMDYIRTAYAKGTKKSTVIIKHAFRNALLPVVTVVALQFGSLLGGSVVTETVFSWPGIGSVIVKAILNRDYPVVQAGVFLIAIMFVFINLGVDLLYALINPKINQE